jgi:N-acetylmuramoyl-L-alanine amidase
MTPVETTPPIDPTLRADAIGPSAVNLRTGPSSSSATLAVLQPGQALHAGANESGWVEVTLDDGTTGWVYSRYLASVAASVPTEVAEADEPSAAKAVVKADSNAELQGRTARIDGRLAVRAKPSGTAEAMFRTEPGERVRILDVRGNWLRIRTADGSSGWIERAG